LEKQLNWGRSKRKEKDITGDKTPGIEAKKKRPTGKQGHGRHRETKPRRFQRGKTAT